MPFLCGALLCLCLSLTLSAADQRPGGGLHTSEDCLGTNGGGSLPIELDIVARAFAASDDCRAVCSTFVRVLAARGL